MLRKHAIVWAGIGCGVLLLAVLFYAPILVAWHSAEQMNSPVKGCRGIGPSLFIDHIPPYFTLLNWHASWYGYELGGILEGKVLLYFPREAMTTP